MKAYLFAILGMLCWGVAPIFGKLGLTNTSPGVALTVRSMVITGILLAWVIMSGHSADFSSLTWRDWLFVGLEGISASLLGHLAYYYALKTGEVSRISSIMAGFPAIAVIMAVLFLGEKLTLVKIGGVVLIITGVLLLKN